MKLTSTHGIVAMRGSGKTYRAMKEAEAMLDAVGQIVAIDPTGAWWGLRLAADGKSVRYPHLLVLGANGALPLEESTGQAVAQLVVNQRLSAVLDLSDMTVTGARRFVAAFLKELLRINPKRGLHTFVDEADLFAPEHGRGESAHSMSAMSGYFRRGRNKGLGGTLITQRVQAIAKDVLWQCDGMTILRLKGTHDIKAVKEWLDSNGFDAKEIVKQLPRLKKGDCFACLEDAALLHPADTCQRATFDSGRTPEPDEEPFVPPPLNDNDLADIRKHLGAAAVELEANDPKALKKRIKELEGRLANAPNASAAAPAEVSVPVMGEEEVRDLDLVVGALAVQVEKLEALKEAVERSKDGIDKMVEAVHKRLAEKFQRPPTVANPKISMPSKTLPEVANADFSKDKSPDPNGPSGRKLDILIALRRAGGDADRTALALLTGYTPTGSSFVKFVGELRSEGYITEGWPTQLTDAGINQVHRFEKSSVGEIQALTRELWRRKFNGRMLEIFDYVLAHGPVGRKELAKAMQYTPTGSSFVKFVGNLRSQGVLTKGWPIDVNRRNLFGTTSGE